MLNMLNFLCKTLIPLLCISASWAIDPLVPLQVWANEAIINTFTFNSENIQARQQDISQYFSPETWQIYRDAFNQSRIYKEILTHHLEVSAVATHPPKITIKTPNDISAEMPILVTYSSPHKTITQNLNITLKVMQTPGAGVREYAIQQFQSINISEPCGCARPHTPKVTIA
jgi:Type-IV b secretion system, inner-membrane complex component